MSHQVRIPDEVLEAGLPKVCLLTGSREGVEFVEVTLNATPPGHAGVDAAAGMLVGIKSNTTADLITLSLPFQRPAWEQFEKHKRLNAVATVVVVMGLAFGLFLSILAAADRNQSGKFAFSVWGVSAVLGLAGCFGHKAKYARGVSCYGRRYGAVGLSIPSKAAADEIRSRVQDFKAGREPKSRGRSKPSDLPRGILRRSSKSAVEFECPKCAKTSRVPIDYAGRKGLCPGCKAVLVPKP
jgi:hypothetical protein